MNPVPIFIGMTQWKQKAEWIKEYSTYLERVDVFEYKFYDLSRFLTGMAERETGRQYKHDLPACVIKRIILAAGGRKRNKIDAAYWNVRPRFELPPTVLKQAKTVSVWEARKDFLNRYRDPVKLQQAMDLFLQLTGGNS